MNRGPTLTVKQERSTLSARKKQVKNLKNILAQPFPRFWPEINETQGDDLKTILEKVMDKKTLSHKSVKMGINSVLRALKHKKTNSVLLSTSIQPKFITTQILTLAISRNTKISILLVPKLESILEKITGISCLTFALTNQEENSSYTELNDWIVNTSKEHPIPEILVNKYTPRKFVEPEKRMEVDEPEIDFDDLYLVKSDDNTREFIPGNVSFAVKPKSDWSDFISLSDSVEVSRKPSSVFKSSKSLTDDYVKPKKMIKLEVPIEKSFQDLVLPEHTIKKKSKKNKTSSANNVSKYVPLIVHKVKGNPNKKKNKKKNNNKMN